MNARIVSFLAVYILSVAVLLALEVLRLPYLLDIAVATAIAAGGLVARDCWWQRADSRARLATLTTLTVVRQHASAEGRALTLLQALCPDQFPAAVLRNYVTVASAAHPGREYRVPLTAHKGGMIQVYEHGAHIADLCIAFTAFPGDAAGDLPFIDLTIARVLGLRADESSLIKLGNWFPMP